MLKYIETAVVFSEIPDEISLDINITNCPYRCPGCHSAYLQQDIGSDLTTDKIDELIKKEYRYFLCSFKWRGLQS